MPTLSHPDPAVRERITRFTVPTPEQAEAKKQRVMAAGRALAAGDGSIKPLNPEWDRRWMDAIAQGGPALNALCAMSEDSIDEEAGMSGHESKAWLVARSALPTDQALHCSLRHYQAIPEYIAGFGLVLLQQAN